MTKSERESNEVVDEPARFARLCVCCTDEITGEIGDFLAVAEGKGHRAISPVFDSLVELYEWCGMNGWVMQPHSTDFPVGLYKRVLMTPADFDADTKCKKLRRRVGAERSEMLDALARLEDAEVIRVLQAMDDHESGAVTSSTLEEVQRWRVRKPESS